MFRAGEVMGTFGLSGSLITTTLGGGSSGGGGTSGGGGASGGGAGGTEGGLTSIVRSLNTEHGSVVPDPRTNSLIVTDIPERLAVIEKVILELDVKPAQIFIEAEVLEVNVDTLRRLGVEYGSTVGQIATYTGPKRTSIFPFPERLLELGTNTHTLGTLSLTDASVVLKLLGTEKDVRYLARPRLLTLSNEVAEIQIVADTVTGVTTTSQATTGTVTSTPERNTVGTILRVTPLVNEDRYITMVIEPEVSRVIQSATFTSFLDPNRRAARTTVMVPDGQTVMIAGLISTEDTESARRVPGLGDLPIVGLPFKRTETERKNTEIILFITPHILREESPIRATQEREQTVLPTREPRTVRVDRKWMLKDRAITATIENMVR
jgi:type II secretory pathway component GspD/PulD (secretin)